MKVKSVPSKWLYAEGLRLDSQPYMSGAIEAKEILESTSRTAPLKSVVSGHDGGIYNGPKFSRTWVDDAEYGIPFLGSSTMLAAVLSNLPLLQRKYAESPKLSHLKLQQGTTLISCSGTIGRTIYTRSEMEGMWSSQHIMKVVPDRSKIKPGYLYAYLSSKFGIPLITSGTYGAIIQHIEPHHITNILVPRLDKKIEEKIHNLVDKASACRTKASEIALEAVKMLESKASLPGLQKVNASTPFCVTQISSLQIMNRFDAFYHSTYHSEALDDYFSNSIPTINLQSFAKNIVEPPRLKRPKVDDPDFGVPFFGTSALMQIEPEMSYFIAKNHPSTSDFIIDRLSVLVPRSGQLSGIIGTAVLPFGPLIGGAVSEDAIRINCQTEEDAGFVYVALTSLYGLRQLKARAYSSSIPHLDVHQIGQVIIPRLTSQQTQEIGKQGLKVSQLRENAIDLEHEAIKMLETAIEEVA